MAFGCVLSIAQNTCKRAACTHAFFFLPPFILLVSVDRGGKSKSWILLEVNGPFGSRVASTPLCLPAGRHIKIFLPKGVLGFLLSDTQERSV